MGDVLSLPSSLCSSLRSASPELRKVGGKELFRPVLLSPSRGYPEIVENDLSVDWRPEAPLFLDLTDEGL